MRYKSRRVGLAPTSGSTQETGPELHLGSILDLTLLVGVQVSWPSGCESRREAHSPSLFHHVVAWMGGNVPSIPYLLLSAADGAREQKSWPSLSAIGINNWESRPYTSPGRKRRVSLGGVSIVKLVPRV